VSRLAAVVLAAGASTRMGAPKAVLVWRGQPFVTHAIALARIAGATPIIVVEGAHALPEELLADAVRVKNDAWELGPLGSLQTGLRLATKDDPTGVLVVSVDRPHVAASTIEALVRAHEREPTAVWQPSCDGKHGHPIVWPLDLAQRVLALRIDASPRDVLGAPDVAVRRQFVHVTDTAVLDNIDAPDDLERLYASSS
jgi:molybdenum cofactor cytidylyltransferase